MYINNNEIVSFIIVKRQNVKDIENQSFKQGQKKVGFSYEMLNQTEVRLIETKHKKKDRTKNNFSTRYERFEVI